MRHDFPKVMCDACKHEGRQDQRWPTLCVNCAQRIVNADYRASDVKGIRADMVASGIPLERRD